MRSQKRMRYKEEKENEREHRKGHRNDVERSLVAQEELRLL